MVRHYKTTNVYKIKRMFTEAGLDITEADLNKDIFQEFQRLIKEKEKRIQLELLEANLAAELSNLYLDPTASTSLSTPAKEHVAFHNIPKPATWNEYCDYMYEKNEGWIIWNSGMKCGKVLIRVLDQGPKLD